jgi:hypothetical protein
MRIADRGLRIAPVRAALGTLAVFVALGALRPTTVARAEVIDRVLAVAAGQVITLSDVAAARELGLQSAGNAPDPVRAILSKLIDRELMLAEVERYGPPEPAPELVERELAAIRARFPSPSAYEATLARLGVDEKQLRAIVRQDLRLRAYLDQRFTPADPRRQTLIDDWVAGLRRRGAVVDLYLQPK